MARKPLDRRSTRTKLPKPNTGRRAAPHAAMGTLLLDIALFVSAALLIPPAFIVASKGPIDGIKELFGEDFVTPYDEDSYFLKHAMMIDCSKNWFLAALYLAAITMEAAAKEKVAILATLLMMLCVSANMIAPPTASIAPYPSLEGITGNPLLLPICGTQIVLLTLGVLFASPSTKKKKPAATRASTRSTRAKRS